MFFLIFDVFIKTYKKKNRVRIVYFCCWYAQNCFYLLFVTTLYLGNESTQTPPRDGSFEIKRHGTDNVLFSKLDIGRFPMRSELQRIRARLGVKQGLITDTPGTPGWQSLEHRRASLSGLSRMPENETGILFAGKGQVRTKQLGRSLVSQRARSSKLTRSTFSRPGLAGLLAIGCVLFFGRKRPAGRTNESGALGVWQGFLF